MTQLRTAWRRAVDTAAADDLDLSELLALLGPDAEDSLWACDDVEALGPSAADLRHEAAEGPLTGCRFAELAAGVTLISDGTLEATRSGEGRPWLAVRVTGDNQFAVATRSRRVLESLRRRFGD